MHAAGFTALAVAAAEEARRHLPANASVLDVGCGDGTAARILSDAGHRVVGFDLSPSFVELARHRAPQASFAVGSFVDAPLPSDLDGVLAVGEVLGYASDQRVNAHSLEDLLARIADRVAPGGFMLFDLATPERASPEEERHWVEGHGWAVLVSTQRHERRMTRHIVTISEDRGRRYLRGEETHELVLHPRAEVLAALRSLGFAARTLPRGYAGLAMPHGLAAYFARRRR